MAYEVEGTWTRLNSRSFRYPRSGRLTWKHPRFKETQEEASSQKASVALDKALTDCNHTEHKHARREPYGRFQLLQDDVRGDLKYNVGHEEDCQSGIVLVSTKLQVGDQTIDGSIRDVGAVQEGQ
jgi:hypothetical protein